MKDAAALKEFQIAAYAGHVLVSVEVGIMVLSPEQAWEFSRELAAVAARAEEQARLADAVSADGRRFLRLLAGEG